MPAIDRFALTDRVAVITGGGGLLGERHARAVASAGGVPVLADLRLAEAREKAEVVARDFDVPARAIEVDVTDDDAVKKLLARTLDEYGRIDILVNNAARNPTLGSGGQVEFSRLESLPLEQWEEDLAVGLTGAFLCARAFGARFAAEGGGVILNVASDLAVIAPDQRLYREQGRPEAQQPVKPVSYSVVKTALLGLTRYLATYWAGAGVRVNAISPGGVRTDQPDAFVARLEELIPLGRMAAVDEYEAAVLFLCSDASSYMTGQNLVIDGGRSVW